MAGEEPYASWLFSEGSELARLMQEDKDLGQYETAQQEAAEQEPDGSGGYDGETAVNEWVHQCWVCDYAGHAAALSPPKQKAIGIMRRTPGFPLKASGPSAAL